MQTRFSNIYNPSRFFEAPGQRLMYETLPSLSFDVDLSDHMSLMLHNTEYWTPYLDFDTIE